MQDATHSFLPSPVLSKFSLFPNLPFELRIKILKRACEPRLIVFQGFGQPEQVPAVIQACKEAHDELMKNYTRRSLPAPYTGHTPPLDPSKDVISFDRSLPELRTNISDGSLYFHSTADTIWVQLIEYLALPLDFAFILCTRNLPNIWERLRLTCPKLKEMIVFCGKLNEPNRPNRDDRLGAFAEIPHGDFKKAGLEWYEPEPMDYIVKSLAKEQSLGGWENLKLTFFKEPEALTPAPVLS